MKPIIIYLDKSDKVVLTKKEFEEYIKQAYDQGYNCGYTEGKKWYTPYIYNSQPYYGNTPQYITTCRTTTDKPLDITYSTAGSITGEAHNTIGD